MSEGTPVGKRRRRPTATANFGSGRREAHDATAFYDRFVPPVISDAATINAAHELDVVHCLDARDMAPVASNSVALVVTSPPYFAGKQYEEDLGAEDVPSDYFEYLAMLRDVFAECARVLEPGGRIAVNVANLGRRPFRSLAGDVTGILSDLGLLLRGEVVWWKGRAAGGSCAWGSFQRPANPVLRDVTERIVIASKGRFDRALDPRQRHVRGLPSTVTISRDEFMEATTDLWEIAPERATRVGHPAPFPVALPRRLIDLYTYEGDVVLDPFMGSGSSAVAAVASGRHYIGFDLDPAYIEVADRRIAAERERLGVAASTTPDATRIEVDAPPSDDDPVERARRRGWRASEIARLAIAEAGFSGFRTDVKPRGLGITLDVIATDATGRQWAFLIAGGLTTSLSGLRHADTLWKTLATAAIVHKAGETDRGDALRVVAITTDVPTKGSAGAKALAALTGVDGPLFDVIRLFDDQDRARLATYGAGRGASVRRDVTA